LSTLARSSNRRAALEKELAPWQGEVNERAKETKSPRRAWLRSPADLALEEARQAAMDARLG
jgi:hypothetical protein